MLLALASIAPFLAFAIAFPAPATNVTKRGADSDTAFVDLTTLRGPAKHVASGWLYGVPYNFPNQVPDSFSQGLTWTYTRAGSAGVGAPCRGWGFGHKEYNCRFQNTLNNYKQARKFGGGFIILPHDIWGVDGYLDYPAYKWPGANGNWTDYDAFLDRLISDVKANNMLPGLVWDIWNEPDGRPFWDAPQQQWLEMYRRTHLRIRSDPSLNSMQISGPTLAGYPNNQNSWWTNWASLVSSSNIIPDQYAWHHEGGGDPVGVGQAFDGIRSQYNLPARTVNLNEYGVASEFTPSGFAWYISRLERLGWYGLLGIWYPPLNDNYNGLLTKDGNATDYNNHNYETAAGYWVYNYYGKLQTGTPVHTEGSTDGNWDAYATLPARGSGDKVRILCGSHNNGPTTYKLNIKGLSAAGYPTSGSVRISYRQFYGTTNIFDIVGPSLLQGTYSSTYSNDELTIGVVISDAHYAYAVEFDVI